MSASSTSPAWSKPLPMSSNILPRRLPIACRRTRTSQSKIWLVCSKGGASFWWPPRALLDVGKLAEVFGEILVLRDVLAADPRRRIDCWLAPFGGRT